MNSIFVVLGVPGGLCKSSMSISGELCCVGLSDIRASPGSSVCLSGDHIGRVVVTVTVLMGELGLEFFASMDNFEIAVFFLDVMDPGSNAACLAIPLFGWIGG